MKQYLLCIGCFCLYTTSVLSAQVCQPNSTLAATPTDQFVQHQDGTLTDQTTGLMWQRCLVGQQGKDCSTGTAEQLSWAEALLYLAQETPQTRLGGYQDWRLPNIRELASLVELQCSQPAINLTLFPDNGIGHVWSSSTYRFYPHYAWFLDFADGVFIYGDRQDKKRIRLVRDITP
ncbi:MAG: DUF1566 domain-containing protein [Pseudomonadota bacterium]